MRKSRVAILFGGYTSERNISLKSGEVVFKHIDRELFEPFLIEVNEGEWKEHYANSPVNMNNFSINQDGVSTKFDIAFIAIHGSPGEDGKIQAYLDLVGVPYSTSDTLASSFTFHKSFCKELVKNVVSVPKGIRVTDYKVETLHRIESELKLPVFVKPNTNGSSYGITRLEDWNGLSEALELGFNYDSAMLIEEAVTGTEVTCGVYHNGDKVVTLPICEIALAKHTFFNYEAKYTQGECEEIIPARISDEIANEIVSLSISIYTLLGCSGVIRIDYIIERENPVFLEVNTVPGLSEASIVPKMVANAGISLKDFFTLLLKQSL